MKDPLKPVQISLSGKALNEVDAIVEPMREVFIKAISDAETAAKTAGIPPYVFYASVVRELTILGVAMQHFEFARHIGHDLPIDHEALVQNVYTFLTKAVREACSKRAHDGN